MSTSTLPPGRLSATPETLPVEARPKAGKPSKPKPTEQPGAGERLTVNDLARRITKGIVEPAFNRPGSEWHERYRELNRAAGVIVGWSIARENFIATAESLTCAVERCFDTGARKQGGARFIRGLRERIAAVAVEMGL